ncbi:DUF7519 family protein [Halovivax gelatinilyticus]|uniref:DUF7519 family protein n=1 Tax=Halovivax gelatinilyticus TaxID=2961597 RepID=UPI0020CA2B04|nr:hypothetical protein [Halovivax gelatinilyticus]
MTDDPGHALYAPPGRSPLLVAFAVLVVLGLGYGAGAVVPVAVAVVSGLGIVGGCCLIATYSIRDRALGGITTVAGLAGVAGSVWIAVLAGTAAGLPAVDVGPYRAVGIVAAAAVTVTAAGVALLPAESCRSALGETARDATLAAAIATPIAALVLDGRPLALYWDGIRETISLASRTPSIALITIQVLTLLALFSIAGSDTARRTCRRLGLDVPSIRDLVEWVREWNESIYWVIGFYVVVWYVPGLRAAIDSGFEAIGPVGRAVAAVLTSGVVIAALLAVIVGVVLASVAVAIAPAVRHRLEPVPLRTFASMSGGAVVPVAILGGDRLATGGTTSAITWALIVAAWIGFVASWLHAPRLLAMAAGERWRSRLVGVAAASLFAGTILSATAGLAPIGVLVGIAATLLVWDLGTNALDVHRTVGPDGYASDPLAARAGTTGVVGCVGVGLGLAIVYGARWAGPSVSPSIAKVSIALSLVAVLAVTASSARREASDRSIGDWLSDRYLSAVVTPFRIVVFAIPFAIVLSQLVHPAFGLFALAGLLAVAFVAPNRSSPRSYRRDRF